MSIITEHNALTDRRPSSELLTRIRIDDALRRLQRAEAVVRMKNTDLSDARRVASAIRAEINELRIDPSELESAA